MKAHPNSDLPENVGFSSLPSERQCGSLTVGMQVDYRENQREEECFDVMAFSVLVLFFPSAFLLQCLFPAMLLHFVSLCPRCLVCFQKCCVKENQSN